MDTPRPIEITSDAKFTFYFDMDGVLCVYDYDDYVPVDDQGRPGYMQPGRHLYRGMRPDPIATGIFKSLYMTVGHHAKIMTGLGCPYLISEQMLDKLAWCHDCLAPFSNTDFLCVYGSKVDAVSALKAIKPTDVLIDDYNPNLEAWAKAGGTPVKYVNHVNSHRDDMFCLNGSFPVAENVRLLGRYLSQIN